MGAKNVKLKDLPALGKTEKSQYYEDIFIKNYQEYRTTNLNKSPSVFYPLLKTLKRNVVLQYIYMILFFCSRISLGFFLYHLIEILSAEDSTTEEAFRYSGIILLIAILSMYIGQQAYFNADNILIKLKGTLTGVLYNKLSKLSLQSLNSLNVGQLINIVANDLNSFETVFDMMSILLMPITLAAGIFVLWQFCGAYCLTGIGFLALSLPLQKILSNKTSKPSNEKNKLTDERVSLTTDLITRIRPFKMFTWEFNFIKLIKEIRLKETQKIRQIAFIEGLQRGLAMGTLASAAFLILLSYYLSGNELTVGLVYVTLMLSRVIAQYGLIIPAMGISVVVQLKLLFQRLSTILELQENIQPEIAHPINQENAIEFEDYTSFWATLQDKVAISIPKDQIKPEPELLKAALSNINLNIAKNKCTAIIGKVGSGKSSLLLSILGEIPISKGALRRQGTISYVEQEIMLFSGTIRENILFGKEYDPQRYEEVINATCLIQDFTQFPAGDQSEIGERGANLSGGQKARISLARAIYADTDIYLLDDPFSAVDPKVATMLYDRTIRGIINGKTIVLVTHSVQLLNCVDKVVILDQGRIEQETRIENPQLHESDLHSRRITDKISELIDEGSLDISQDNKDEPKISSDNQNIQNEEKNHKIYQEEDPLEANVTWNTYKTYFKACLNKYTGFATIALFAIIQISYIGFGTSIGYWASNPENMGLIIGLCGMFALLMYLNYTFEAAIFTKSTVKGAREIHNQMLEKITLNKIEFF